jgi:glycerol-3-phosphate O-acyltransferase/dihydroxyacetone phosphate acyltransferase
MERTSLPRQRSLSSAAQKLAPMNNFVYDILLWSFGVLVDLFFREVHPRSSWRVPRKGPVLFVAAPHANQVCCE